MEEQDSRIGSRIGRSIFSGLMWFCTGLKWLFNSVSEWFTLRGRVSMEDGSSQDGSSQDGSSQDGCSTQCGNDSTQDQVHFRMNPQISIEDFLEQYLNRDEDFYNNGDTYIYDGIGTDEEFNGDDDDCISSEDDSKSNASDGM